MIETIVQPTSAPPSRRLTVHVDQLDPNPFQPRRVLDSKHILALADSITQFGMLDAPTARLHTDQSDSYQLIDGQNRFEAVKILAENGTHEGFIEINLKQANDREMLEMALTQNIQRQQLGALDKAWGFAELEKMGLTQNEIGEQYNYSQPAVANFIRLLGLPDNVRQMIRGDKLSAGHGNALLALPKDLQALWANRAFVDETSVKALEKQIRAHNDEQHKRDNPTIPGAETETNPPVTPRKTDVTDAELDYVKGRTETVIEPEKPDAPAVAVTESPASEPPAVTGPPQMAMVPASEMAWMKSVGLTTAVAVAHLRRFYGICEAGANLGRVLQADGLGGALDYLEQMHGPIATDAGDQA